MGNTLSCCKCPNASPKLSRHSKPAVPDYESELSEAVVGDTVAVVAATEAGDAVAVAAATTAVESAELDFGAGEGHHLPHISDREMPEDKQAAVP